MRNIHILLLTTGAICLILIHNCASSGSQAASLSSIPETIDFNFHIRPILSDRCYACHGPDEKAREADLRLDTEAGAFAALGEEKDSYAIVRGDLEKSMLYHRIHAEDPDEIMPPPESNLTLSDYEKKLLEKWITQGAEWKTHWAFTPPQKVEMPEINQSSWPTNEIDYFVLAKMENMGLKPNNEAHKAKLLRRLSFDITGLPPTIEELDAFLQDESQDAYEKQVDRLLASEAYGERMTSIWLDAARYADSHGYQDDRPRTMWPWRDWVIRAFNQNMPYDSFIIHQLAGDLLPYSTYQHKLATGFNRNHAITQEGGVVNEEYITEYAADRVQTASTAFMGLTMECARCHDHKYDPFSQKDYYQLFAFFNNIDERGQVNYFDLAPKPNMQMQDEAYEAHLNQIVEGMDSLQTEIEAHVKKAKAEFRGLTEEKKTFPLPESKMDDLVRQNLKLDVFDSLNTIDEINLDEPAKMNTGLVGEIARPVKVAGKYGKALQFDGHNFLNLGREASDFEYYDPFTLSAWIKHDGKREKAAGILVKRNGEQKRGGYELLLTSDNRVQASLIHNHGAERITVTSLALVPTNEWQHLAMRNEGTASADGLHIFINGKKVAVKVEHDKLNRKSILNGNDLLAGNWTPRNLKKPDVQGFENGAIDEIFVYARALSEWEIAYLAEVSQNKGVNKFDHYLKFQDREYQLLKSRFWSVSTYYRELPSVMVMEEMEERRQAFVLDRGVYSSPREEVFPNTPENLLPFDESWPKNRLGLAQWMVHPDHSLTARVMVNRIWQMLFGRGLVKTPEDFGSQGDLPSHPALLDWLAVDFRESGWDIKGLIKKIVMSATYRQSSHIESKKYEVDAENILLARGPNVRLSAEMVRDQALATSGLLVQKVGGPWVKPYQPKGVWRGLANQIGENKYRQSREEGLYRRSLYTYWKRTIPPPSMLTFDAAERVVCVVKRQSTSTPLQSLVLLNDPQYVEASRVLAAQWVFDEKAIELAFRTITSRYPEAQELAVLQNLYDIEYKRFQADSESANELLRTGKRLLRDLVDPTKVAALTVVVNTIFNLDEAKMKS